MINLLLVDDEERMIDLLKLYLEPNGYHCIAVSDGFKAIQFLKENTVQLVLMDVMMPKKNGWETLKEIRAFSDVPVVMITARDQYIDIVDSIQNGANGHITKPFNENQLLLHIATQINNPLPDRVT